MSKVQYDAVVVRKDAMYTVSKLCHKLSHELRHMEYGNIHVIYHYCSLDDICVLVAIVESMPLKYDTT